MEYIAIFIDGAYLQKIVNSISSNNDRLDMEKLVLWIAGDLPIRRVYYYDCLPYQSDPASDAERERVSKKQKFFRVLERIDRFEVRLGRLEKRGEDVSGKPIFDQKEWIFKWDWTSPFLHIVKKLPTRLCYQETATFALQ